MENASREGAAEALFLGRWLGKGNAVMAIVLCWVGFMLVMVAHAAAMVGEEPAADGVADAARPFLRKGYLMRDVDSKFFKSDVLLSGEGYKDQLGYAEKVADQRSFPALEGLGISMSRMDVAPRGFNPPHEHPCVSELMFVMQGSMLVGFVDPDHDVIYQTHVKAGDLFVYPRGLVHFQLNDRDDVAAVALSTFNSEYPELARVSQQLFSPLPSTSCD